MVKRRTYKMSKVNGQMVVNYEDEGVVHHVVHELPERQSAEAQQRNLFRNMPRKERNKTITSML